MWLKIYLLVGILFFFGTKWILAVLKGLKIEKRELNKTIFVLEFGAFIFALLQLAFNIGVPDESSLILKIFGLFIFTAGVVIGKWSRLQLKENYAPAAFAREPEWIVVSGPYKLVRHPVYLGTLLFGFGFEMSLVSPFILVLFITIPFFVMQIEKEEWILAEVFLKEWVDFKKKTPFKLIPYIY